MFIASNLPLILAGPLVFSTVIPHIQYQLLLKKC